MLSCAAADKTSIISTDSARKKTVFWLILKSHFQMIHRWPVLCSSPRCPCSRCSARSWTSQPASSSTTWAPENEEAWPPATTSSNSSKMSSAPSRSSTNETYSKFFTNALQFMPSCRSSIQCHFSFAIIVPILYRCNLQQSSIHSLYIL